MYLCVAPLNWLIFNVFFFFEVQIYMLNALFAMATNSKHQSCKLFTFNITLSNKSTYSTYNVCECVFIFFSTLTSHGGSQKKMTIFFNFFCWCHRWRCSWIILLVEVFVLFWQICSRPRWSKDGKVIFHQDFFVMYMYWICLVLYC